MNPNGEGGGLHKLLSNTSLMDQALHPVMGTPPFIAITTATLAVPWSTIYFDSSDRPTARLNSGFQETKKPDEVVCKASIAPDKFAKTAISISV
jgi:hypothetical protein